MLASVPVKQLKRTAQGLGLDVPGGTDKADLVAAVGKKARAGAGVFLIDPKDVSFVVESTFEELSPEDLAVGYARHRLFCEEMDERFGRGCVGATELRKASKKMTSADLRASTDPEIVRHLGEYEKAVKASRELDGGAGWSSETVKVQATAGFGGKIASVEVCDLRVGERKASEDEVFFVGPKLWHQGRGCAEPASVPLDEAGVCTLGAFAKSVAETKIGGQDSSHCFFECPGHEKDDDGATVVYSWGS